MGILGPLERKTVRKWLITVLFLSSSCTVIQEQNVVTNKQAAQLQKSTFFIPIPIEKLSSFQCPCINIEIEEKTLLTKLDLGFQGDMALEKEILDSISSRTFIGEKTTYGMRGREYKKKLYQIPKAKIGVMAFSPPIIQEENRGFLKDAEFLQNKENSQPREEKGRLGWELFYNTPLLIDIKNSQIVFCDSLATLKSKGYAIEAFVKTSLCLENGLVEFEVETSKGCLHCILDTGSTWNILNSELQEGESIDVVAWESENILEFSYFKIEGANFGPIAFHQLPIRLPIRIEAILGMEFFKDHLVFLDFAKKIAYFAKNVPE